MGKFLRASISKGSLSAGGLEPQCLGWETIGTFVCPKYRMMIYDGCFLHPTDESRQLVSMEIHGSSK